MSVFVTYCCVCRDGVLLVVDCREGVLPLVEAVAVVAGPLATGVGVCRGALRGKCLMFTLIPSSTTSSTPVCKAAPFLSRTIFTFKL